MKYVEKHFTLRVHRSNGTSKLLLGINGSPRIGSIKQVRVAEDEVLTVRIVKDPNTHEPAEAVEVNQSAAPSS